MRFRASESAGTLNIYETDICEGEKWGKGEKKFKIWRIP